MRTLQPSVYYHEDWAKIKSIYDQYNNEHRDQIDSLQEWIKKEPHLPLLSGTDLSLMLSITQHSTEATKVLIDDMLTHKSSNPEFFQSRLRNMKKVEQCLDLLEVGLPDPWEYNYEKERLSFIRVIDTDPNKLDFHVAMQVFSAVVDYEFARVGLDIDGVAGILDMEGVTLGYLPRITITDLAVAMKYITMIETKIARVHIINCNPYINHFMTLLKPFMSKHLANKIFFHTPNQMEEFFKIIPKSLVPSTYGGTRESMSELNEKFRKRFRGAEDFIRFCDSENFQVNENLRRNRVGHEVMNGSFRKLCID